MEGGARGVTHPGLLESVGGRITLCSALRICQFAYMGRGAGHFGMLSCCCYGGGAGKDGASLCLYCFPLGQGKGNGMDFIIGLTVLYTWDRIVRNQLITRYCGRYGTVSGCYCHGVGKSVLWFGRFGFWSGYYKPLCSSCLF